MPLSLVDHTGEAEGAEAGGFVGTCAEGRGQPREALSVPVVINEEQAEERAAWAASPRCPAMQPCQPARQESVGILCHADPAACLFATLRFFPPVLYG